MTDYLNDGLSFSFKVKSRFVLLITLVVVLSLFACVVKIARAESPTLAFDYDDALTRPDVYSDISKGSPPGYEDTSEYLIGDVAVGIIFLESNGTIDPSTENWTSAEESEVISEVKAGLTWLTSQNPDAGVSFAFDIHYKVPTSYEPINRASDAEEDWIGEAMTYLGYPPIGYGYHRQVLDYINDLRNTRGTDWAYAMFIVDSSNDADGEFTDGLFAYAYLGGPFLVMTYDNNGFGVSNMDKASAHETCHIFYATDEYDGETEYSGYLNVSDNEGSGCLMDTNAWWLCTNSREQLGWRDSDGDGIQDIVDTFPNTTLNPYSPDPTTDTILTYTGSVAEVPYPNNNPQEEGRDVTINTVTDVEFRVDFDSWVSATPTDGAFDEDEEAFTFTTPPLLAGTHTIEIRGINSVDNIEASYANDTVTIAPPTFVSISTSSSSTFVGFGVNVTGALRDVYGNGLKNETVVLYYTLSGVVEWVPIASASTDDLGDYHAVWIPPATGYFVLKAEWAGNTTHLGASNTTTLSSLAYNNQHVFSVESNSTISELAFNATNWRLSFTATGPDGTRGYVKITVAKDLVADITSISVSLDGDQTEYSIASTVDSWLLTLDYVHSTHQIVVDLDTTPPAILVLFPENKTYPVSDVPLTFTVSEPTSWIGYSLDEQANATIAGNITLTSLLDGLHYVVVYANDPAGNVGASSTVYFTVDTAPPSITDVSQTPLVDNVLPEDEVKVNVMVIDELSGVKQVSLNYTNGNGTWIIVNMTNLGGNGWNATIPVFPYGTNVTYSIIAEDKVNNSITTEDLGYEYQYTVIPEFPTWTSVLLILVVLTVALAITKRRFLRAHKRKKREG